MRRSRQVRRLVIPAAIVRCIDVNACYLCRCVMPITSDDSLLLCAVESQNLYYHALVVAVVYHQSTSVLPFLLSRPDIQIDIRTRSYCNTVPLVAPPGCTALFVACEQCSEVACRLLLSHGARSDVLCSTAEYVAHDNGQAALDAPLVVAIRKKMHAIALQMIDQLITSYNATSTVHPFEVLLQMPQRRALLQILALYSSSALLHSLLHLLAPDHRCRRCSCFNSCGGRLMTGRAVLDADELYERS